MPPGYVTTAQAAKLALLTPGRIRQLAQAGAIKSERVGRDWLVSEAEARRMGKANAAKRKGKK